MTRLLSRLTRSLALLATLNVFAPAHAAVVVNSLPYTGTPDWTDTTFAGTSMTSNGTTSVLTTGQNLGVWFGYGVWYGDTPAWTPGSTSAGNYLAMTSSFSANAADWSAYFYDMNHMAYFEFNSTGCGDPHNCYSVPHEQGVRFWHADGGNATQPASSFLALDLTQAHTFEWLLKSGQVSYRIDGNVVYSGLAYQVPLGAPLLIIGDGSGSTLTGLGSMTIQGIAWDNAPVLSTLAPIPEPETYALMLAGLGLVGWVGRKRKA